MTWINLGNVRGCCELFWLVLPGTGPGVLTQTSLPGELMNSGGYKPEEEVPPLTGTAGLTTGLVALALHLAVENLLISPF